MIRARRYPPVGWFPWVAHLLAEGSEGRTAGGVRRGRGEPTARRKQSSIGQEPYWTGRGEDQTLGGAKGAADVFQRNVASGLAESAWADEV